ncbi:MAG: DUF4266 domain-containing protein [Myxococcales bacterium]|nr:DUF4266 domain-containing protein [Myxococcales bacterium]
MCSKSTYGGLLSVIALCACVSVFTACGKKIKSWQRGTLAHPCMTEDSRPEELFAKQHMLGARESTQGASGETGGGCGCN